MLVLYGTKCVFETFSKICRMSDSNVTVAMCCRRPRSSALFCSLSLCSGRRSFSSTSSRRSVRPVSRYSYSLLTLNRVNPTVELASFPALSVLSRPLVRRRHRRHNARRLVGLHVQESSGVSKRHLAHAVHIAYKRNKFGLCNQEKSRKTEHFSSNSRKY